jgi:hypothetical protein
MGAHIDRYGHTAHIDGMKTTLDIADSLLRRAKAVARRENTTLKSLAEEGLELALARRASQAKPVVEPVVFGGDGLSAEFRGRSWSDIRDEIYRGYGS